MLPSVFEERLFDNVFGDPFAMPVAHIHDRLFGRHGRHLMKADVRELENSYELDVDLPGFKKEEIGVELADGCLTICACKGQSREEEKPGQYIRRERSFGECRRTFYVGEGFGPKDVAAKYEDGILKLSFPKAPEQKEPEETKVAVQ
jgi:HSP20 family molecular chaperone IbpA